MSKIFSVLITAHIVFSASTAIAACQAPAPVPPPEPEYVVPQVHTAPTQTSPSSVGPGLTGRHHEARPVGTGPTAGANPEASSLRPLSVTPISTNLRQQDNSQPLPVDQQGSGETLQTPTSRPLPDIVKCCPLSSITLSQSIAKVSRKNEALPVPPNEASEYSQSHGIQIAPRVSGTSSLRHPEPVFFEHLYFEDPNLERCGAGHGIATELVSAVRFFGRAPLVPYMVGSLNNHQCVQSLGDCPVCHRYGKSVYLPPLNARGVAFEVAAVVGLVFLLP